MPHFIDISVSSKHITVRTYEAISRTNIDLSMVDKLPDSEDKNAYHQLLVSAEVAISIRAQDDLDDHPVIKGERTGL